MGSIRNRYIKLIAFGYMILALLWILLSDQLLSLFTDVNEVVWLSTAKGLFFVLSSTVGIFFALRGMPDPDVKVGTRLQDVVFSGTLSERRPAWITYSFATIITVLLLILRLNIGPTSDHRPLMILFMLPILLSALLGGVGPGILATILSAICTDYFILSPHRTLEVSDEYDLLQLGILVFCGLIVSVFSEMLMRMREKSENNLKLLNVAVSGTKDAVFVKDRNGYYLVVNQAAADYVGKPLAEILGKDDRFLFPVNTAHDVMKRDQEIMQNGRISSFEEDITSLDGNKFIFDVTKGPMYDNFGNVNGLFGICRDITEFKQAEVNLQIAAVAFESQDSIMITDASLRILRINKAFTETFGYTADDAIGKTPKILHSGKQDKGVYSEIWKSVNTTGCWKGEILNRHKNGKLVYNLLTISAVKGDDDVVSHYVGTHLDITERKADADKVLYIAFHDLLTQLPNRQLLNDRLKQIIESVPNSTSVNALLMIDLDNFKTLNDTLGHDIGDLLLQKVAERLLSCVRPQDMIARLGGDEFVILLENLGDELGKATIAAERTGSKILRALNRPYQLGMRHYQSSSSIGATMFSGNQLTISEVLKQADISMYSAKRSGRNALHFFDPVMQDAFNNRASLEIDLRKAIEHNQFQLYYQLQVDEFHNPIGAEALIRWIHPERGVVSPLEFIPLAEETGLILPIGQWVLETACAQLEKWKHNKLTKSLTLSVNVSPTQFGQADFVQQVFSALNQYHIESNHLKLELTESIVLSNLDNIIERMSKLESFGVQFSLDDFGTGYSSLQYLKRLPLNQLKIDQSFIKDIVSDSNDGAIVRTIIAMANSLGLDVIAEGVETEDQKNLLINEGCHNFQGYLFGRPASIEQFEAELSLNYGSPPFC